jgi:hypothetical protein
MNHYWLKKITKPHVYIFAARIIIYINDSLLNKSQYIPYPIHSHELPEWPINTAYRQYPIKIPMRIP